MPNKRPYFAWYDGTLDNTLQQGDNPETLEFLPFKSANRRLVAGADGQVYAVGDLSMAQRGTKAIVWSSEGYSTNGITVPALTAAQKRANGTAATNIGLATVPTGMTLSTTLDFSPYRNLTLAINAMTITGTSLQFELDCMDDSGTPVTLALWKPAALTAPGALYVSMGPGVAFTQAAAASNTAPTGFGAVAVPSGWTYYTIPLTFLPNGTFAWTATALTGAAWTAFIYGSN